LTRIEGVSLEILNHALELFFADKPDVNDTRLEKEAAKLLKKPNG
jgi:hypothetical protein